MLDVYSTVSACALAICLGFQAGKLMGLPGIQISQDLGSNSASFTYTEFLDGKRKCICEVPAIRELCPTKKGAAFAREKKCLQEGTKPPSKLIKVFVLWKIMATSWGACTQLSTKMSQILFW